MQTQESGGLSFRREREMSPPDTLDPSNSQVVASVCGYTTAETPLTHTIQRPNSVRHDATGRTDHSHKYKKELARCGRLARSLEEEVNKLEQQYKAETKELRILCEVLEAARQEYGNMEIAYKREQRDKEETERAVVLARRRRDSEYKRHATLKKEIRELNAHLCTTQEETHRKYIKYLEAWTDRQKILRDTEKIDAERHLLEKKTDMGVLAVQKLEETIVESRCDLQQTRNDAKESDVSVLLRATKLRPGDEGWFAARTRAVPNARLLRRRKTTPP